MTVSDHFIFFESAGFRAVREAVATAGALMLQHFVHVMNVLHLWMHGVLGTDFTAPPQAMHKEGEKGECVQRECKTLHA